MKNFFKNIWNYIKKNYLFLSLGLIFLIIDQITKVVFDYKIIDVINGVFSFHWSHNTGAGFSVLQDKVWLLIIITIVFMALLFVFNHFQKHKNSLYRVSMALIISGAFGNLIDRVFLGYVRDFLSFDLINFPIFNFADSCLTIGVILLAIFLLFVEPKIIKAEKNNAQENKNDTKNIDADENENN